mmetsp:Transcript_1807/g.3926  ORF Transcript_1807/g.3926 Transcript_1807/m.3926 type:complete len:148 (-) Transcript_1807:2021-2464(-)
MDSPHIHLKLENPLDFSDALSCRSICESLLDLDGFEPEVHVERRSVETQTTMSFSDCMMRTCKQCQRVFVSMKGMKQHLAKVHDSQVKPTKCTDCGKSFKDKYAVKFHMKQVHASTRVMCPICLKEVYNKYMLQKHFKNKHLCIKTS